MSKKRRIVCLTTEDNPYDPVNQWDEWLNYDNEKGYGTCQQLALFGKVSDNMTADEYAEENEKVIDEIVKFGFVIDSKTNEKVLFKKVISFV